MTTPLGLIGGINETGETYGLRDPREAEIRAILSATGAHSSAIADALESLPGLFPKDLLMSAVWKESVRQALDSMLENGTRAAVEQEAAHSRLPWKFLAALAQPIHKQAGSG